MFGKQLPCELATLRFQRRDKNALVMYSYSEESSPVWIGAGGGSRSDCSCRRAKERGWPENRKGREKQKGGKNHNQHTTFQVVVALSCLKTWGGGVSGWFAHRERGFSNLGSEEEPDLPQRLAPSLSLPNIAFYIHILRGNI